MLEKYQNVIELALRADTATGKKIEGFLRDFPKKLKDKINKGRKKGILKRDHKQWGFKMTGRLLRLFRYDRLSPAFANDVLFLSTTDNNLSEMGVDGYDLALEYVSSPFAPVSQLSHGQTKLEEYSLFIKKKAKDLFEARFNDLFDMTNEDEKLAFDGLDDNERTR